MNPARHQTTILSAAIALAALVLVSCTPAAEQHHAPALGGADARGVDLPGVPGPGEPREVRTLVDEQALKLVTIVLRAGTVLPPHQSAVPVTIVALQGGGIVVAGGERLPLDANHAVVLRAGVSHAVEPAAGADLVLLVHHMGRGEESHK